MRVLTYKKTTHGLRGSNFYFEDIDDRAVVRVSVGYGLLEPSKVEVWVGDEESPRISAALRKAKPINPAQFLMMAGWDVVEGFTWNVDEPQLVTCSDQDSDDRISVHRVTYQSDMKSLGELSKEVRHLEIVNKSLQGKLQSALQTVDKCRHRGSKLSKLERMIAEIREILDMPT